MSNTNAPKDPQALLLAFANMLNEFYEPEGDDVAEVTAQHASPTGQVDLEFDRTPESKHATPSTTSGPWEGFDVKKKMGVSLQVRPELYKKMIWLIQNVPQMSHQKLAMTGLEAEVERLLSRHYRPE